MPKRSETPDPADLPRTSSRRRTTTGSPPADSGELRNPPYLIISRHPGHLSPLRNNSPMPPGSGPGHTAASFGEKGRKADVPAGDVVARSVT